MINPNELHHNGWYLLNGKTHRYNIEDVVMWKLDCYEGIDLTSEILEKAGFFLQGKTENTCHMWLAPIWLTKLNDGWLYLANQRHVNLFYLHQLQNLYFALTGKELEITL